MNRTFGDPSLARSGRARPGSTHRSSGRSHPGTPTPAHTLPVACRPAPFRLRACEPHNYLTNPGSTGLHRPPRGTCQLRKAATASWRAGHSGITVPRQRQHILTVLRYPSSAGRGRSTSRARQAKPARPCPRSTCADTRPAFACPHGRSTLNPAATHPGRDGRGHDRGLGNRRAAPGRDGGGYYRGLGNWRPDHTDSSDARWPKWHCQSPEIVRMPDRPRSRR
jgi:hypothetical protein